MCQIYKNYSYNVVFFNKVLFTKIILYIVFLLNSLSITYMIMVQQKNIL